MIDKKQIKSWIESHKQAFLADAMELIRIRSVSEKCEGEYPYGLGCAKVLDKALEISARKGLDTENHAYHCGSAMLRGRSEREIGIFTHLDVVHEGTNWQSDPYQPHIQDEWLFGRGSADNKAPAMSALYAMSFLREQGIALEHTIRLYFGCDEERGMEDIAYYTSHYQAPDFSLVPDAAFPVCYAEKGIIEAELSTPLPGKICDFSAGIAPNSVPNNARVALKSVAFEEASNFLAAIKDFRVQEKNGVVEISATGRSAHAAFPEGSESAAVKLAQVLCEAPFIAGEAKASLRFIGEALADYHGEAMGIACADEVSGSLTMIGGMSYVKEGRLVQNINVRYPVSADQEGLVNRIHACEKLYRWNVDWIHNNPPHCIDPQSMIVAALNTICCEVLQMEMEPYAMGGGTYARKLPNAVGYGPGIRGQAKPCPPGHGGGHQPDECVLIDNLIKAIEIYIRAIVELDRILGKNRQELTIP